MEYQNMTNEQIKRRIEWIDRELFCIGTTSRKRTHKIDKF